MFLNHLNGGFHQSTPNWTEVKLKNILVSAWKGNNIDIKHLQEALNTMNELKNQNWRINFCCRLKQIYFQYLNY